METEGTSLTDILSDDPIQEEALPEPEPQGQLRDETGKFVSIKGVEPPAAPEGETQTEPVPPPDKLPKEEYKAVKEEREKRQALERDLEALKKQIQQLQQPQTPPAPPPSVWEDENAWGGHLVTTAVTQAQMLNKVQTSEMLMRQAEPDFESLKATYLELEKANPSLIPQVMNDPHPWNKAIQIAKNHKAMQDLGATSIDDLRAKLREELMAEMQTGQSPVKQVPPTLTGERSVASRSGPAWSGPTPLSDMLR